MVKNPPDNAEMQVQPLSWEIPWMRKWQHTPIFLPEKFYGQKNVVGHGVIKESDMT